MLRHYSFLFTIHSTINQYSDLIYVPGDTDVRTAVTYSRGAFIYRVNSDIVREGQEARS